MHNISNEDRQLLLNTLINLPPEKWLSLIKTSDQRDHFFNIWIKYQQIYLELKSYFSGEASELEIFKKDLTKNRELPKELKKIKKRRIEVSQKFAQRYLKLYDCLFYAYSDIQELADRYKYPLPAKPGECLQYMFVEDYWHDLTVSLSYTEINPRKLHEIRSKNSDPTKMSKKLKSFFTRKEKEVNQRNLEERPLNYFCSRSLQHIVNKKEKGDILRKTFTDLKRLDEDIMGLLTPCLHPSKVPRGFNFINGRRTDVYKT